jgi:hypothetical protein
MWPVGFYINCDDALCIRCIGQETEDPIFASSEVDRPIRCSNCGDEIETSLTDDGIAYITGVAIEDIKFWDDLIQQIAGIREVNTDDFKDTLLSIIGKFVESYIIPVHYWEDDRLNKDQIIAAFFSDENIDPEKYTRQDIRQLLASYPNNSLDYCGSLPKCTQCIFVYPHTKYYQYLDPHFIGGYKLEIYNDDAHCSYHADIDSLVATLQEENLTLTNWSI